MTYAQFIILLTKHHVYAASRDDGRREQLQKYMGRKGHREWVKFTSFLRNESRVGEKFPCKMSIKIYKQLFAEFDTKNVVCICTHILT